jgi:hypothetical protein
MQSFIVIYTNKGIIFIFEVLQGQYLAAEPLASLITMEVCSEHDWSLGVVTDEKNCHHRLLK